jgi:hypothetical protein
MAKIFITIFTLLSLGLSAQQGFSVSIRNDTLFLVRTDTIVKEYSRPFADSAALNAYLFEQANALLEQGKKYQDQAEYSNKIAQQILILLYKQIGKPAISGPMIFPENKPKRRLFKFRKND